MFICNETNKTNAFSFLAKPNSVKKKIVVIIRTFCVGLKLIRKQMAELFRFMHGSVLGNLVHSAH